MNPLLAALLGLIPAEDDEEEQEEMEELGEDENGIFIAAGS